VETLARDTVQKFAAAVALVILAAHFSSFDVVHTPLVTDVRYYVYFASQVAGGATPHLDFFENKTQLAVLVGGAMLTIGSWIDQPLFVLRAGFLGLAGIAGLLAFAIHRQIAPASAVSGLLGVVAYCAFPLLGFLPSVGVIPKLLMAIGASTMGFCVYRGWWFAAGLAGALAFMDWQVGALAGMAAFAAALFSGAGRVRAAVAVAAGSLTGLAAFAGYFAANGALQAALRQTFVASFARGSTTLERTNLFDRLEHLAEVVQSAGPDAAPLFYLSGVGVVVAIVLSWLRRETPAGHMLLALSLYHVLIVAFSAVDFQRYGDLFILLHSAAFFLAFVFNAVLLLAVEALRRSGRKGARSAVEVALLIAAIGLARPAYLRSDAEIPISKVAPGTTLGDQREVAHQIEEALVGHSILFLDHAEIPFLMGYTNPSPFIYWNSATLSYARSDANEGLKQAARRLLEAASADAYVIRPKLITQPLEGYSRKTFESRSGRYSVNVFVRDRK
jgi:hypothetical protein